MKEKSARRKRWSKAAFRKWAKENPEEYNALYGPLTSLEATIAILEGVLPSFKFKEDGSDVLGEVPFEPIDACEFVCGFAMECGYDFSQPLCDTIAAYMQKGSTKTVKELSEIIERVFISQEPKPIEAFCDSGGDCRHFSLHEAYKEDQELCEVFGDTDSKQQCLLCKHWDNTHDGEPCDCTTGKCTYRWQDPNGDKQQTFWKEN